MSWSAKTRPSRIRLSASRNRTGSSAETVTSTELPEQEFGGKVRRFLLPQPARTPAREWPGWKRGKIMTSPLWTSRVRREAVLQGSASRPHLEVLRLVRRPSGKASHASCQMSKTAKSFRLGELTTRGYRHYDARCLELCLLKMYMDAIPFLGQPAAGLHKVAFRVPGKRRVARSGLWYCWLRGQCRQCHFKEEAGRKGLWKLPTRHVYTANTAGLKGKSFRLYSCLLL